MLETPALSPNSHCLQFWYVLNGRTMGTLSVSSICDRGSC